MSALLFLTSDDFNIQKGNKGNVLCHTIPGFSLILFYSTQCAHCQKLIPNFKKLPGTVGGCQFGMINVSTNKKCIMMAKETITPITYVPYIILYHNFRPWIRYNGPNDVNEIRRFIIEVANKMQTKQKFIEDPTSAPNIKKKKGRIPEYTTGIPLCGEDEKHYLIYEEAYPDKKSDKKQQR